MKANIKKVILVGFVIMGCAQNRHLLIDGKLNPCLNPSDFEIPNLIISKHLTPDSVRGFTGNKVNYIGRFWNDKKGNTIKAQYYNQDNSIKDIGPYVTIKIDTLGFVEIRTEIDSNGKPILYDALAFNKKEKKIVGEHYNEKGKFIEAVYLTLDSAHFIRKMEYSDKQMPDSTIYSFKNGINVWRYKYKNGRLTGKEQQFSEGNKLTKLIAYTCKKDSCREAGVLYQYYIDSIRN